MIDLDKVTKTKGGYKVLMAKYFPDNPEKDRIIAVVDLGSFYDVYTYFENGQYENYNPTNPEYSPKDLVEDKQEITKWCNVYKDVKEGGIYGTVELYDTEEQAIKYHDTFCSYVKAVPITVEI